MRRDDLRRLEAAAEKRRRGMRPSVEQLTVLVVKGTATPEDFIRCMPEVLACVRSDFVTNVKRLDAARREGRLRVVLPGHFATIAAATPPDQHLNPFIRDRLLSEWDHAWPPPFGKRIEGSNQCSQYRTLQLLAALETPDALDLRRELAANPQNLAVRRDVRGDVDCRLDNIDESSDYSVGDPKLGTYYYWLEDGTIVYTSPSNARQSRAHPDGPDIGQADFGAPPGSSRRPDYAEILRWL